MDAMDIMLLHEQYKPPIVSVGELVLFRRLKRPVWSLAWAFPPQSINWQPGQPLGKKINLLVSETNFGQPKVEMDCVHIGDPLYVYDKNNAVHCWEKINPAAASMSDILSFIAEVQAKLNGIETRMDELGIIANNATADISRISADLSFKSTKKKSALEVA